MEPLISVIIPVYNVLPYLREALDSVIHQTWKNLEIIIVDDGSTDGSGPVCDEYLHDSRVQVIHQENRGLSGARNTGLDKMTGEYVGFLDSDDAFHPEMIQQLYDVLIRHQADIAICGYDVFRTEGQMESAKKFASFLFGEEKVLSSREALIALMSGNLNVSVWNRLYRKELWNGLRFPEGHVYEDLLTTSLVFEKSGRIVMIPQALVSYRKREGSITATNTVQNRQDQFAAHQKIQKHLEQIQPALPSDSIHTFRETNLRRMILSWAELCRIQKDSETTVKLKQEIINFAGSDTCFRDVKTKATWMLFRHSPRLLLPVNHSYLFLKQVIFRRE